MESIVIEVKCQPDHIEILIAELSGLGYESFMETETGFIANLEEGPFDPEAIEEILIRYSSLFTFTYSLQKVEKTNWNEAWEKNYDPIIVEDKCIVKASFHQIEKNFPYEIVINPKMSFGTGHHETTYLMLKSQMDIEFQEKSVIDVGCGTGILAIMAKLRGANQISACDIDSWCIENSEENFALNQCKNIHLNLGEVTQFNDPVDILLANINRNVLLNDLPHYSRLVNRDGFLLISGFYTSDESALIVEAENQGFHFQQKSNKNDWACILFKK